MGPGPAGGLLRPVAFVLTQLPEKSGDGPCAAAPLTSKSGSKPKRNVHFDVLGFIPPSEIRMVCLGQADPLTFIMLDGIIGAHGFSPTRSEEHTSELQSRFGT